MSRSGYTDDAPMGNTERWSCIRWRGAVKSAFRGQRGQRALRDMLAAMEALPGHRLIAEQLESKDGDVCALGALAKARHVDMHDVDPEDADIVAANLDIAEAMAREIVEVNDEWGDHNEAPERRWGRMRAWLKIHVRHDAKQMS